MENGAQDGLVTVQQAVDGEAQTEETTSQTTVQTESQAAENTGNEQAGKTAQVVAEARGGANRRTDGKPIRRGKSFGRRRTGGRA